MEPFKLLLAWRMEWMCNYEFPKGRAPVDTILREFLAL